MDITNSENTDNMTTTTLEVETPIENTSNASASAPTSPRRGRPKKTVTNVNVSADEILKQKKIASKKDASKKEALTKDVKAKKIDKNLKIDKVDRVKSVAQNSKNTQFTQSDLPQNMQAESMFEACHTKHPQRAEKCTHGADKNACHAHHKHDAHHVHHDHHVLDSKHPCYERAQKKKKKREIAKIGMVASLGLLTVTGFSHVLPYSKKAHAIAGLALLGFSIWHANLYANPHKKKVCTKKKEQDTPVTVNNVEQKPQTA